MRFFFYGTLMDDDLRAELLGPANANLRVTPGVLLNHRRRAARDGHYPVLIPEPRGRVPGVFVDALTRDLLLWIAHFEGPTYTPEPVTALDATGQRVEAWSFLPTRRAYASDRPWDLRVWQHRHKPSARRMLALWRRQLTTGLPLSLDAPWTVRRRIDAIAAASAADAAPAPQAGTAGRLVPTAGAARACADARVADLEDAVAA